MPTKGIQMTDKIPEEIRQHILLYKSSSAKYNEKNIHLLLI